MQRSTRAFLVFLSISFFLQAHSFAATESKKCVRYLSTYFIKSFEKTNLPINLSPSPKRLRQLQERYSPERIERVLAQLKEIQAFREMKIVGGIRGNSTKVLITIKSNILLMMTRNAIGDPRTPRGRENIRTNVRIALNEFKDVVLSGLLESF